MTVQGSRAGGRIRNKAEGLPCPPGWVLNKDGLPSTDPLEAREKGGFLTSLGGSPENSSYQGYGLAVMVNILGSCLSGATLITDPIIDPGLFRDREEFTAEVTRLCNDLWATTPVDPAQPVMVAGDPQWNNAAKRLREGIPVGPGLLNQIAQDRRGATRSTRARPIAAALAIAPTDRVRRLGVARRIPARH